MQTLKLSLLSILSCAILGCATQVKPGAVVVAPKVQIPPVPTIVQQAPVLETGYFQSKLATFFGISPSPQIGLTKPSDPVAPTLKK